MHQTILFVEDDQDDVFLIERACKTAGLDATRKFKSDGKAAVEYLSEVAACTPSHAVPNVIFLDLNMPRMGGLDFLGWLRQQRKWEQIPVVVLTTSENSQDIQAAYRAGANAYLIKPASISQFAEMLSCATHFWLKFNRV